MLGLLEYSLYLYKAVLLGTSYKDMWQEVRLWAEVKKENGRLIFFSDYSCNKNYFICFLAFYLHSYLLSWCEVDQIISLLD